MVCLPSAALRSASPRPGSSNITIWRAISQPRSWPSLIARPFPANPKADNTPDDACTATVLRRYGLSLFRRPPTDARLSELVTVANKTTEEHRDFYAGLRMALVGLLAAPDFLFRVDLVTMAHPGQPTLDDYSKAARLSYFLWDAEPDAELLAAAAQGDLDSRSGLARQVDRLIASPRLDDGVRAFFTDFLGFDEFAHLEKDGAVYPAFNPLVAKDAEEQTLKTVTNLLLARHGDYRDLFTNRDTFMTRRLGLVYGVPVESKTGWDRFHFPDDDPRGGLLTQASFTALHSHPGRSSPTLRGKAIRELLLCQPVPAPPNNVNFAVVQDTSNPNFKTARDRLTAHRTETDLRRLPPDRRSAGPGAGEFRRSRTVPPDREWRSDRCFWRSGRAAFHRRRRPWAGAARRSGGLGLPCDQRVPLCGRAFRRSGRARLDEMADQELHGRWISVAGPDAPHRIEPRFLRGVRTLAGHEIRCRLAEDWI